MKEDDKRRLYPITRLKNKNPNWKGGRTQGRGYVLLYMPEYPGKKVAKKYVYEHRLVMEQYLERPLTSEEWVHHKNGCRSDNEVLNLHLCTRYTHPRAVVYNR